MSYLIVLMSILTEFILIVLILFILFFLLKKVSGSYFQSNSNFECGFNSFFSSMLPFSVQFFSIAILFLIFDLEIILFLPLILAESKILNMMVLSSLMITILTVGLLFEWKLGLIEWTK